MINHQYYTYRVIWSQDDQEHIGLCAEFTSLSYLDNTPDKALKGIIALVQDVITDMQQNNENIPIPLSQKEYSGKIMVRIPPEQHRDITIKAIEQGVSLNRYISSQLL